MPRIGLLLIAMTIVSSSCTPEAPTPGPSGSDAGEPGPVLAPDGGGVVDAGGLLDPVDAGPDGGDELDAGPDGGGELDAGPDGGGQVDAGGSPGSSDEDGDGILDAQELGPDPVHPRDTDGDGTPDFRDLDSDGDCRPDQAEAGGTTPPRDSDGDLLADFHDLDSDGDGLGDQSEDANCNGQVDGFETDPSDADSDNDGASDLVEVTLGTSARDASSNPEAEGDLAFLVPYQGQPTPADRNVAFSPRIRSVDLYVIVDRSGSMVAEGTSIRSNLSTVVRQLSCPPLGTGDPATCIPDLWAGAGTVGYSGSGADTFRNQVDLQPNPNFITLPINEPGGCCAEPLSFALYSAITGQGTASVSSCGLSGVSSRATCAGSPAANAGFATYGYPCFREGALPIIALATDEAPLSPGDTNKCPAWTTLVQPQFHARSARFVGIYGSGSTAQVISDLNSMATSTGAVDSANGNAPLVFNGDGVNAAAAIEDGVRSLANGVPLDLGASTEDDPADAVNAVVAFVERVETNQLGTAACSNGLVDRDTNADTFADEYIGVRTGTPVCWRLVASTNTTVPATGDPQLFRATVTVRGDGITTLDTRDVFFIVPPAP